MSRKPSLPKSLNINGIRIPVKYDPHVSSDAFGSFKKHGSDGPVIELHVRSPKEIVASTLLHEGLHALADLNGIDLSETQVQMLESLLPRFISENWQHFKDIIELETK